LRATLFGHPRGLTVLFLTGMWEVFALFGMRSVLIYYLADQLHKSPEAAIQIYSTANAACLLMGLAGGFCADRVLGMKRAVVLGALLMAVGHFLMFFEAFLFPGLAAIALGNGLLKPTLVAQVGLLYESADPRRDQGFSVYKVGCNAGATLAPFVCGALGEWWGWKWAFVAAGAGMLVCIGTYLLGQHWLPAHVLRTAVSRADAVDEPSGRSRSGGVLLATIWISALLFWTAYNQVGGTLALWAEHDVDRTLAFHRHALMIPAAWFQSINPFLIFAVTPIVNWWWGRSSMAGTIGTDLRRMALGMTLMAVSFLILAGVAVAVPGPKPSYLWLVLALIPFTIAEIYVDPIGQSVFTRLAMKRLAAFFVALWFLSYMVGFITAGWLSEFWLAIPHRYYFGIVALTAIAGGTLLMLAGRSRKLVSINHRHNPWS
jgi:proton-dependent oligopeptide transporter, POT family